MLIQEATKELLKHSSGRDFLAHGSLEVLTGLLWIALTIVAERTVKWFRARSIEKRFPVAGRYLAHYVDKGVKYTELLSLRQRGRKVSGEKIVSTEAGGDRRKWLFDAEVKEQGYLQGGYIPESPFDKGFGGYFLRFLRDGDLLGYWFGKDAEETGIQFGEYRFRKQPDFTIGAIHANDVSEVLQIAEQQLGDAYLEASSLKQSGKNVALCTRVDDCVIGFATGKLLETSDFLGKLEERVSADSQKAKQLTRRLDGEHEIGFVASAAVKPEYAGRGLGAELIGRTITALEDLGANVLVATAWRSNAGVQAGSILEYRGFRKLFEIEKYWEKDSLQHQYSCPTCGAPPCQCSAVVYIRNRHVDLSASKN